MTPAHLETQLLRLADAIQGYREHEACIAIPTEPREQVRAALNDLVVRGKRAEGGRYWRVRAEG
jgi:hypothetical protein